MFKPTAFTALALLGTSLAHAESYTIQIGAFKTPSAEYAEPATVVGEIYATERDNGVVALSVGRFDSNESASAALDRISSAFPAAYVRRANPDARRQLNSTATAGSSRPAFAQAGSARDDVPAPTRQANTDTESLLATLTASERKHVVYLDGELHFKQGEQFVPLAEYRARNQ